jgi:hypothetical protein
MLFRAACRDDARSPPLAERLLPIYFYHVRHAEIRVDAARRPPARSRRSVYPGDAHEWHGHEVAAQLMAELRLQKEKQRAMRCASAAGEESESFSPHDGPKSAQTLPPLPPPPPSPEFFAGHFQAKLEGDREVKVERGTQLLDVSHTRSVVQLHELVLRRLH